MGLCFPTQNNQSAVEPETYLYYLHLRPSRPSQGEWVPYDESTRATIREDFRRLWATGFLDDLRIEADDYTFANGVVGTIVTYNLEERARIRLVRYDGTGDLEQNKIDEELRDKNAAIKLDTFIDQGLIRRARTILRDLEAQKGYAAAEVALDSRADPRRAEAGAARVHGEPRPEARHPRRHLHRQSRHRRRHLEGILKGNRPQGLLSLVSRRGTYDETTYADDAQKVEDFYRDHGYVAARVGQPEVRALDDSADGRTRWVQLRIPVYEGRRYKVGTVSFDGGKIVRTEALQAIFKLKEGQWYRQELVRKGLTKAREIYGSIGHMEFTGYPDLKRRDQAEPTTEGTTLPPPTGDEGPAIVDVVMRLAEGPRYVINRISFRGNTTTRDDVIRRELMLYEGGVFDTNALKNSVRRLNTLGYFKTVEDPTRTSRSTRRPASPMPST